MGRVCTAILELPAAVVQVSRGKACESSKDFIASAAGPLRMAGESPVSARCFIYFKDCSFVVNFVPRSSKPQLQNSSSRIPSPKSGFVPKYRMLSPGSFWLVSPWGLLLSRR